MVSFGQGRVCVRRRTTADLGCRGVARCAACDLGCRAYPSSLDAHPPLLVPVNITAQHTRHLASQASSKRTSQMRHQPHSTPYDHQAKTKPASGVRMDTSAITVSTLNMLPL